MKNIFNGIFCKENNQCTDWHSTICISITWFLQLSRIKIQGFFMEFSANFKAFARNFDGIYTTIF